MEKEKGAWSVKSNLIDIFNGDCIGCELDTLRKSDWHKAGQSSLLPRRSIKICVGTVEAYVVVFEAKSTIHAKPSP